jgi:hypothetical protein
LVGRGIRRACLLFIWLSMLPATAFGQLTFTRVVELVQNSADADSVNSLCKSDLEASRSVLLTLSPYASFSSSMDLAALSGIPSPLFVETPSDTPSTFLPSPQDQSHSSVGNRQFLLWCALTAYAELVKVQAQTEVVTRRRTAADRLLEVESRRVIKKLDDPVGLVRARFFEARTQLSEARLNASERYLRAKLVAMTGFNPIESLAIEGALPPISEELNDSAQFPDNIRQLALARDVAQLEFVLAVTNRNQMRVKMVLGRAHFSELLTAYLIEQESLDHLIELNFDLQRARMYALLLARSLEKWVSGAAATHQDQGQSFSATLQEKGQDGSGPIPRSLMITPGISELATGHSQQFSATAILTDGKAMGVTSKSVWECRGPEAIVSMAGLVTALQAGSVIISARFSGVLKSLKLTITPDDWTPWTTDP